MNTRLTIPILLSCSCMLFAGCSKEPEKEQQASTAKSAVTAEQISAEVVSVDPALAQQGKVLYEQNCIFCHQADAIGKPGIAPSLTNQEFLSVVSDKFLLSTVRDGRPGTGMPPFAHLGRKDVEAIVAYLREHAKIPNISAEIDAQPHTQGDPRLGQIWFDSICSTCHGPNGDGYSAGSTGTAIGKAGFLDKASDGFIRTTIKKGRSNTRMVGFSGPTAMAALTDRDIDDVIAYIRTLPTQN